MNKSIHNIHVYCTLTVLQCTCYTQGTSRSEILDGGLNRDLLSVGLFSFCIVSSSLASFAVSQNLGCCELKVCVASIAVKRARRNLRLSFLFLSFIVWHKQKSSLKANCLMHAPFLMLHLPAFCCTDWSQVCSCSSRSATETMSDCPHLLHVQCFCMYTLYSSAASDAAKLAKVKRITCTVLHFQVHSS